MITNSPVMISIETRDLLLVAFISIRCMKNIEVVYGKPIVPPLLGYIDLGVLRYNDQYFLYILKFFIYIEVRKKIDYRASHGEFGQHFLLPEGGRSFPKSRENGWGSTNNRFPYDTL